MKIEWQSRDFCKGAFFAYGTVGFIYFVLFMFTILDREDEEVTFELEGNWWTNSTRCFIDYVHNVKTPDGHPEFWVQSTVTGDLNGGRHSVTKYAVNNLIVSNVTDIRRILHEPEADAIEAALSAQGSSVKDIGESCRYSPECRMGSMCSKWLKCTNDNCDSRCVVNKGKWLYEECWFNAATGKTGFRFNGIQLQ